MLTDEELIERMARGDQEAFELLVTRYHGPLLSYTIRQLGDRDKAQDVVQETMIRLLRHLQTNARLDHVKAWLYRVAMNLCRDYWRSATYRSEYSAYGDVPEMLDLSPAAELLMEQEESALEISQNLRWLGYPEEDIVRLRFFHDLKLQEIAVVMDMPLSTVKSHLYKALKKLKSLFTKGRLEMTSASLGHNTNNKDRTNKDEKEVNLHESATR